MSFDDFIDSAPSVLGAGLTGWACLAIPSAIPLALMQGTIISDPAQIWHAGDRHATLAGKAGDAKTQLTQAMDKRATDDKWSGQDKTLFAQTHVDPYKTALDQTADMHNGISGSLNTLAKVYMGAGILSASIGTSMFICACYVASLTAVPGLNAASRIVGETLARAANTVFRGILRKLLKLVVLAGRIFKGAVGQLALAAVGFGGGLAEKMDLGSHKTIMTSWPGEPIAT